MRCQETKLSTAVGALARGIRVTGLVIGGSSILQSNTYLAGGGILMVAAGEGLQVGADYLDAKGS